MNQDEFLAKLFSLYATTFNRGNGNAWSEAYKQVLKPNIDYDKLYEYMLANYAGASAPSPAFLLKNATYIYEPQDEDLNVTETLLVRKGKETYEFGVKLADYKKDIEYFNREGLNVIKFKFCKPQRDCPHCNYNGVCLTTRGAIA